MLLFAFVVFERRLKLYVVNEIVQRSDCLGELVSNRFVKLLRGSGQTVIEAFLANVCL